MNIKIIYKSLKINGLTRTRGAFQIWRIKRLNNPNRSEHINSTIAFPKHMMNPTHTTTHKRFATGYMIEQRLQGITTENTHKLYSQLRVRFHNFRKTIRFASKLQAMNFSLMHRTIPNSSRKTLQLNPDVLICII